MLLVKCQTNFNYDKCISKNVCKIESHISFFSIVKEKNSMGFSSSTKYSTKVRERQFYKT